MRTAGPDISGPPADAPLLPSYGQTSLADLSDSLLASLGVPGASNPLGLAPYSRACLLLVDGLGWELLRSHRSVAPFLSGLAETGCWLTAGFPATTATSLGSLGTARPPGQHGLLGYQVRVPDTGQLLNELRWDNAVDPVRWQPGPTIFERTAAAGIAAIRVAAGAFRMSGLSVATMRGADYHAADTPGALVASTAAALAAERRALALVYTGDLDATGHTWGCESPAWRFQLGHVDRLAEQLAGALPSGAVLYVTAGPAARLRGAGSGSRRVRGVAVSAGRPRVGRAPRRGHRGGLVRPGGQLVRCAHRRRGRGGARRVSGGGDAGRAARVGSRGHARLPDAR